MDINADKKHSGSIVAMVSGKGGAGKTSAGISIAYMLSQMGLSVLLLDFDLATNGASFFMKNKMARKKVISIWDMMASWQKVKKGDLALDLDLENIITSLPEGFDFLASRVIFDARPLDIRQVESEIEVDILSKILTYKSLVEKYDYIIVDCQAGYSTPADVALEYADKAIIVSELDPISNDAADMLLAQAGSKLPEFRRFLLNKLTVDEMDQYEKVAPLFRALNRLPALPHDFEVRSALGMGKIPVDLRRPSSYLFALFSVIKEMLPEEEERIEKMEQEKISSLVGEYEKEVETLAERRAHLAHALDAISAREGTLRKRAIFMTSTIISFVFFILGMLSYTFRLADISISLVLMILGITGALAATTFSLVSRKQEIDAKKRLELQRELENLNRDLEAYQSLIYTKSKDFRIRFPMKEYDHGERGKGTVYFKCRICGEEHKSPISFGNKSSFQTSVLKDNVFQCPETGKMASYDKSDMYWKEE